ncbi:MAG: isochorismatase family protein [Patescibacteria group bacterium]
MTEKNESALIVVDVQNDFCPGGALPVLDGHKVVPILNDAISIFDARNAPIFATRCWHVRENRVHFKPNGRWPEHCLQSTKGAEFHPDLKLPRNVILISKGMELDEDAYSPFGGTGLEKQLRENGIKKIWIGGLAFDYCVKAAALDGKKLGFDVVVFENASRSVNVSPNDHWNSKVEMWNAGVKIMNFPEFD